MEKWNKTDFTYWYYLFLWEVPLPCIFRKQNPKTGDPIYTWLCIADVDSTVNRSYLEIMDG